MFHNSALLFCTTQVGIIYQTYHNKVFVHTGSTMVQGVEEVISSTLQNMYAFPDRKVIGENVVWSGNDKDGFYSSHRIISSGTNLGESLFGPATNKKIVVRTIADTIVNSNKIVEEWLVRDNLSLVKQLGFNPIEVAKKLVQNARTEDLDFQHHSGLPGAMEGQLAPSLYVRQHPSFDVGEFVLEFYNNIWECRLFQKVKEFYSDNAVVHYIDNKDLVGHDQIQGMLVSLFASFPNAKLVIERVTCNNTDDPKHWDISVRWRLQGLHEGIGFFGKPSNAQIEILGISQLNIINERIVEEWLVFDAIDVLRQIYIQTSDLEKECL